MGIKDNKYLVKRTEIFEWENRKIEIKTIQSHKYFFIDDTFVYVDGELVAQTNRENAYGVIQEYKRDKKEIPDNICTLSWKNIKSDKAEGSFYHKDKTIPITLNSTRSIFSYGHFILNIDGKEYVVGKQQEKTKSFSTFSTYFICLLLLVLAGIAFKNFIIPLAGSVIIVLLMIRKT